MAITNTHTADISISDMLNGLPNVFGIEDIVAAFGISEIEAMFIADYIENEDRSVLGGEGRWIRLPSEEVLECYPAGYHRLGYVSDTDRLEAFYGEYTRRIEGLKVLEYSGVPLMSTLSVASPKIEDSEYALDKFKILHRHEKSDTLVLHSEQIDSKTWISTIERCLLELADKMSCTTILEYLMIAIEEKDYSSDKIISVAMDLNYSIALRKIGSIVHQIPDNHYLPDTAHEIAEIASEIKGDWEELSDIIRRNNPPVLQDETFRITWRISPEKVFYNTLT